MYPLHASTFPPCSQLAGCGPNFCPTYVGMHLKVWLVCKHPSHLGMQLKNPVYKKLCIVMFIAPSTVAVLAVSLSCDVEMTKRRASRVSFRGEGHLLPLGLTSVALIPLSHQRARSKLQWQTPQDLLVVLRGLTIPNSSLPRHCEGCSL